MTEPKATHTGNPATDRRALLAGIGGLAAGALLAGKAQAGPLNPPPGPISSTPGPEPRIPINQTNTPGDANNTFRITQPGSYYFPGNLFGEPQKSGILIASSDVTIDMMGFRLQPINVGSASGIVNSGSRVNITIRNGVLRLWEGDGINLTAGGESSGILVEGVQSSENVGDGIRVGSNATVVRCTTYSNGGSGIRAARNAHISMCQSRSNAQAGLLTGDASVLEGCIAQGNGSSGIFTGLSSVVQSCVSTANLGSNIGGVSVQDRCLVDGCVITGNMGIGVQAGIGSTIRNCEVFANNKDGIFLSSDCLAEHNHCVSNGTSGLGAGIYVVGGGSRVVHNNCNDNRDGIYCSTADNFIAANTCSGNNRNWFVAGGNVCLVLQASTNTAINGNSGGTSPGSTNPNANYTY